MTTTDDEVHLPTPDEDKAAIKKRFEEVFGTTDHPLFEKMMSDYDKGRARHAILSDLDEAAADKGRSGNTTTPVAAWHNENLAL